MKRTFLGVKIKIDSTFSELYQELKNNLPYPQLHWVDPENLHLTLRFFGNSDEHQITSLSNELSLLTIQYNSFNLEVRGLGIFGSRIYPRIIWAGINLPEEIFQLKYSIEEVASKAGFQRELKPYTPHLTLCRIRNYKDDGSLNSAIDKYRNTFFNVQKISDVVLYESILHSSGSVYTILKTFMLKNTF